MDIEQFYARDERRRDSGEVELGDSWTSSAEQGMRFEISWIEDTKEVYSMREPVGGVFADPLGDEVATPVSEGSVRVEVLGSIDTRADLDSLLAGWQEAMKVEDSISWVRERLETRRPDEQLAAGATAAEKGEDLPRRD